MKNSSEYINEKVLKVNKKYQRLQNLTEELFFRCLDEERSVEYFIEKLDEIWGNIDHSYIQEDIDNYVDMIQEYNLETLGIQQSQKDYKELKLLALSGIALMLYQRQQARQDEEERRVIRLEETFEQFIARKYEQYYNSPEYKNNKEEYLKLKVPQYNSQIVPYRLKNGDYRWVQLSTYVAMIHNSNMTRSAWNNTISDGIYLGYAKFYIPPHSFSCEHCVHYQGRILELDEVLELVEDINTREEENESIGEEILHPNCKCQLLIYHEGMTIQKPSEEQYYDIRQKVNTLTLKKERLLTEIKIQKRLGNQDEVDKLNNQRNVINSQIRDLINELPTTELKRKVVAINR
jgi:hypothetical protein